MRAVPVLLVCAGLGVFSQATDQSFLTWSQKQADAIGKATRVQGRVGGIWDVRGLKTDQSYNYKLTATWLTPDVVRATARLRQLTMRVSDAETVEAVQRALVAGDTTVLVEIDPREGSGVIPLDWVALLAPQTAGGAGLPTVPGRMRTDLRDQPIFAGVVRRDYNYDRFWVTFPLKIDGHPAIPPAVVSVDLIVRIHNKEGHVTWPITEGIGRWLSDAGR